MKKFALLAAQRIFTNAAIASTLLYTVHTHLEVIHYH